MPFAPTPAQGAIRFDEPVRNLLRQKSSGTPSAGELRQSYPAVWSIAPESTVYQAVEMMSRRQVGALIVLSAGSLAGIISERDYARKVILRGRNSQHTLVREIMTTPVLYVTPEQTVDECMHLMTSRRIRHLPVLEGDSVVGMLSIGDLVNWIVQSQDQTIQHLKSYIAGSYPG
jgi:signal-transduction protein with cAMP-binding, CBS, and nucleotidyltransferase domain